MRTIKHILFRNIVLYLTFLISIFVSYSQTKSTQIQILDEETKKAVSFVSVITTQKHSILSDENGIVNLSHNTKCDRFIIFRSMGYEERKIASSEILSKAKYIVYIKSDDKRLEEVSVNAVRRATSVNAVSSRIKDEDLQHSIGKSLAELLDKISGISTIQSGANVSKPVIHGMHGNRILIVNNGVRQSGQQWGESHAPELDMSSSSEIYVVKGSESLRFGAEAMGGIIVLDQKRLNYNSDKLSGNLNTLYASNGKSISTAGSIEGAFSLPKGNIALRLQGSYGNGGDHQTANYYLNNTGHRTSNINALLGYEYRSLGLELFYSRYDTKNGVLRYAHLGNSDNIKDIISRGRPYDEILRDYSRDIDYPNEHVNHHTLSLKANYITDRVGSFFYQVSQQWDDRREYRIRRNNNSHIPEVALNLATQQHQFRWGKKYSIWRTELGTQYLYSNNYSTPGNGVPPIIPNYVSQSWGVYAIQKLSKGKWNAEAGVRLDGQHTNAVGFNSTGNKYGGKNDYINFTYSLGSRYKINNNLGITSNFGVAWRAPHVHELYSDGVEHGSGAYLIGNKNLKSEQSYKWVSSLQYHSTYFHINIDAYLQWVNNFIYDEPQRDKFRTTISGYYPIFLYKQTEAFFRGIDLDLEITPIKEIKYHISSAMIWANERGTGAYLPYIPPFSINHELTWCTDISKDLNLDLVIGHKFVAKQNRFDPNKDLIDFSPEAYNLFSAEMGLDYKVNDRHSMKFLLSGENIFNKEYKEYTNRARYYSHDLGRNIRVSLLWQF